MTSDGPDLAALGRLFAEHRPRLYLTNAGLQNPTGATLSQATAHRVLRLAEDHDVLVLEDDTFADFEAEPAIRLAGLDGLRRVVQVGSATKTVGAAVRCGYIAARPDWIAPLVDLKLATTMGNSATGAAMLHRVLTECGYRRHLDALRRKAADAMGLTLKNLRRRGEPLPGNTGGDLGLREPVHETTTDSRTGEDDGGNIITSVRFSTGESRTASSTPTRAKLFREEPDAGKLHVRVCLSFRGQVRGAQGLLPCFPATALIEPWIEPRAGIFAWARLPDGVDAADVARHAIARKVMFAPGPAFSASELGRSYLRFNVARCGEPRVYEALDEAIAAAARSLAAPG